MEKLSKLDTDQYTVQRVLYEQVEDSFTVVEDYSRDSPTSLLIGEVYIFMKNDPDFLERLSSACFIINDGTNIWKLLPAELDIVKAYLRLYSSRLNCYNTVEEYISLALL